MGAFRIEATAILTALFITSGLPQAGAIELVSVQPAPNAYAVDPGQSISLEFNRAVQAASIGASELHLYTGDGRTIPYSIANVDTHVVEVDPQGQWRSGDHITVWIGRQDLPTPFTWQFHISTATTDLNFNRAKVFTGEEVFAVATGDFDGSGQVDLAVVRGSIYNRIELLRGSSGRNYVPAGMIPIADNPTDAATGDFNLDGVLDLAIGHWQSEQVSVLLGNGDFTFTVHNYPLPGSTVRSHRIEVADLNEDGWLDIVSANRGGPGSLSILTNQQDGTFVVSSPLTDGSDTRDVQVGDWDNDGRLDLAVAAGDNGFGIHLSLGGGTFDWFTYTVPSATGTATYKASSVDLCPTWDDVHRPGRLDMLGLTSAPTSWRTPFDNRSLGAPTVEADSESVGAYADYATNADLDGSGSPDLINVNYLSGRVRYTLNYTDPGFSAILPLYFPEFLPSPESNFADARRPIPRDMDGDGAVDLVVPYRAGGGVYIWWNDNAPLPPNLYETHWATTLDSAVTDRGYPDTPPRLAIDAHGRIHAAVMGADNLLRYALYADGRWADEVLGEVWAAGPTARMDLSLHGPGEDPAVGFLDASGDNVVILEKQQGNWVPVLNVPGRAPALHSTSTDSLLVGLVSSSQLHIYSAYSGQLLYDVPLGADSYWAIDALDLVEGPTGGLHAIVAVQDDHGPRNKLLHFNFGPAGSWDSRPVDQGYLEQSFGGAILGGDGILRVGYSANSSWYAGDAGTRYLAKIAEFRNGNWEARYLWRGKARTSFAGSSGGIPGLVAGTLQFFPESAGVSTYGMYSTPWGGLGASDASGAYAYFSSGVWPLELQLSLEGCSARAGHRLTQPLDTEWDYSNGSDFWGRSSEPKPGPVMATAQWEWGGEENLDGFQYAEPEGAFFEFVPGRGAPGEKVSIQLMHYASPDCNFDESRTRTIQARVAGARGSGNFQPVVLSQDVGDASLAIGRVEGPGQSLPNIVLLDPESHVIHAFDPETLAELQFATNAGSVNTVLDWADLDRDGQGELVLASVDSPTVKLLEAGALGDSPVQIVDHPYSLSHFVQVLDADLDGDAWPDLVMRRGIYGMDIVLVRNLESVGWQLQDMSVDRPVRHLDVADVSGDLRPDLVFVDETSLWVWENRGVANDGLIWFGRVEYPLAIPGDRVLLVDLDGDLDRDIVVASFNSSVLECMVNDGSGTFVPGASLPVGPGPKEMEVGEFDGDGIADVATLHADGGELMIQFSGGGPRKDISPPVRDCTATSQLELVPVSTGSVGLVAIVEGAAGRSLVLWGPGSTSVGTGAPSAEVGLLSVDSTSPGVARFKVSWPDLESAQARIYDLRGRQVWESSLGAPEGPLFVTEWRGRDMSGQRVSRGGYVIEIGAGGQVAREVFAWRP